MAEPPRDWTSLTERSRAYGEAMHVERIREDQTRAAREARLRLERKRQDVENAQRVAAQYPNLERDISRDAVRELELELARERDPVVAREISRLVERERARARDEKQDRGPWTIQR